MAEWDRQPGQSWVEAPGLIQMETGIFVPTHGWLTSKRSVIYGGRHGPAPMIDDGIDTIMDIMVPELRSCIRAIQHRLREGA